MLRKCQCCGNTIFSTNDCGREADHALNWDYCSSCYKHGYFFENDAPVIHDKILPFKPIFVERADFRFYSGYDEYVNLFLASIKKYFLSTVNAVRHRIKNIIYSARYSPKM